MKIGSNVTGKNKLGTVFNANDEEPSVTEEPKKKLSRLNNENNKSSKDSGDAEMIKEASVDDKRKMIKNLIEKIPTVKEELFLYSLKWDIVDEVRHSS